MPQSPKRKCFQVHLSTAVILMFAAGGFIWANVLSSRSTKEYKDTFNRSLKRFIHVDYGWPTIVIRKTYVNDRNVEEIDPKDLAVFNFFLKQNIKIEDISPYTSYSHGALNLLIALLGLVITWFLCERWIDYRAARKGR